MSSASPYKSLVCQLDYELEVKKSRFLVRAKTVKSRDEALRFLSYWREHYPDARHHCWAYVIGNPTNASFVAMSDDGEPSGTAGKPILNACIGKNIGDICCVVIRYFGGTKLGAGGLIRAYGAAVRHALDESDTREVIEQKRFILRCDFSKEQLVRHWLDQGKGRVENAEYGEQVEIELVIDISSEVAFFDFCKTNAFSFQRR